MWQRKNIWLNVLEDTRQPEFKKYYKTYKVSGIAALYFPRYLKNSWCVCHDEKDSSVYFQQYLQGFSVVGDTVLGVSLTFVQQNTKCQEIL